MDVLTCSHNTLRFLLNEFENSYEQLLENSGKSNMNLRRIRFLCIEIYKAIYSLYLDFKKKKEKKEKFVEFHEKKTTELSRIDIS